MRSSTQSGLGGGAVLFIRTTPTDPGIDFRELELPKPADPVRRKCPVVDPPINGVAGDAEMLGDFDYRVPPIVHLCRLPTAKSRKSAGIVEENRTDVKDTGGPHSSAKRNFR
jgi:hypothetical protein